MRRRGFFLLVLPVLGLPVLAGAQPAGVPPVPPRRIETMPPRPAIERLVWQPGHWAWDAGTERYVWHHGQHVMRRPGATRFVAGRWVASGGGWTWRRARWR